MNDKLQLGVIGAGAVVREIYQYLYFQSDYSDRLEICAVAEPNEQCRNWFGDLAGLPANALCARQVAATTGRGVSTADGLVGRLSVHKVGVSCYSFHSGMRSGSADTSPRLSHDTENNCNVTHPTRLRYNRCKPGLGPRLQFWGQRLRTQRF